MISLQRAARTKTKPASRSISIITNEPAERERLHDTRHPSSDFGGYGPSYSSSVTSYGLSHTQPLSQHIRHGFRTVHNSRLYSLRNSHVRRRFGTTSRTDSQELVLERRYDTDGNPIGLRPQRQSWNWMTEAKKVPESENIRSRLRTWEINNAHMKYADAEAYEISHGTGPMSSGFVPPAGKSSSAADVEDDILPEEDNLGQEALADEHDGFVTSKNIKVGDLAMLYDRVRRENGVLAVAVREGPAATYYLRTDGRWMESSDLKIAFKIDNWASVESLEPLQKHVPPFQSSIESKMARDAVIAMIDMAAPRDLTAKLIHRMQSLQQKAAEVYRQHASVLDNAYELLAHETDLRFGSLTAIAASLLRLDKASISQEARLAVFTALNGQDLRFIIDPLSARMSEYLQIRPKAEVQRLAEVVEWLRIWQQHGVRTAASGTRKQSSSRIVNMIDAFIAKASQIVKRSRQTRTAQHGYIGPSSVQRDLSPSQPLIEVVEEEKFTLAEQQIISFLEAWSANKLFSPESTLSSLPPLLLKALDLYNDIDEGVARGAIAYLFLQELGVAMPYHSSMKENASLLLLSSGQSKPLQRLAEVIERQHDSTLTDLYADHRHDWGASTVYCIDSAGTVDIDDGISLEPGPNNASEDDWWVHVHIANPTAYLDRGDPMVSMARHMGAAYYAPDGISHLLPVWAKETYWSLAAGRSCLTVSFLLGKDGEMLDTNVRLGKINNVVYLTHAMIDEALMLGNTAQRSEIIVGGTPPQHSYSTAERLSNITPEMLSDLQILQRISTRRTKLRVAAGGEGGIVEHPSVKAWLSWDLDGTVHPGMHRAHARSIYGDPIISARFKPDMHELVQPASQESDLVTEMMMAAGEAASTWAELRSVPLINRGSQDANAAEQLQREFWARRQPAIDRYGGLPRSLAMSVGRRSINYSTRPLKHPSAGLAAYCRITSPMRRYADMVNHWQLQSAVYHEATSGASLLEQRPGRDDSFLPYDHLALKTLIDYLLPRETMTMRYQNAQTTHWLFLLLFRAHHFKQAQLPEILTVSITSERQESTLFKVWLHELGDHIPVAREDLKVPIRFGQVWEVALERVNMRLLAVEFRWIRVIKEYSLD